METTINTPKLTASIGYTGAAFHYDNCASHPLSFHIEYRDPALRDEGNNLAQFVLRACSNYERLVAALEAVANEARVYPDGPRSYSSDSYLPEHIRNMIRDTLALARGETQ